MLYSKDLPECLFIHFTDKAQLIVFSVLVTGKNVGMNILT